MISNSEHFIEDLKLNNLTEAMLANLNLLLKGFTIDKARDYLINFIVKYREKFENILRGESLWVDTSDLYSQIFQSLSNDNLGMISF